MRSYRAEVRIAGGRWVLQVPALDNLRADGDSLIEAEWQMRKAIAAKFLIGEEDIYLELQDLRALSHRDAP
jgi:hypothetical protein